MSGLYPSWIEIPAENLERALSFYRAVFRLTDTPIYDDYPPARIALLLPSDKSHRNPGLSLVHSPKHKPTPYGTQINFHVGSHAKLDKAIEIALANGGTISDPTVELEDGVKYAVLLDSEGNSIALSSYGESPEDME